jgi:hypothetical protein
MSAAQKEGWAAARRAAEQATRGTEVRSLIDKNKSHKRLDRAPSKTKR